LIAHGRSVIKSASFCKFEEERNARRAHQPAGIWGIHHYYYYSSFASALTRPLFMSAPPFLPMAASLVITKEEIEIFIYQQRERASAGVVVVYGGVSWEGKRERRAGGVGFPISTQMNYARGPKIKNCGLCERANEGTDERAGAQDNGGIIAAYLFSRTDTV
jgi:hypothetical protein